MRVVSHYLPGSVQFFYSPVCQLFALVALESFGEPNICTEPSDCLKCKECGNFMKTKATLCVYYVVSVNPGTPSFAGAAWSSYSKIDGSINEKPSLQSRQPVLTFQSILSKFFYGQRQEGVRLDCVSHCTPLVGFMSHGVLFSLHTLLMLSFHFRTSWVLV